MGRKANKGAGAVDHDSASAAAKRHRQPLQAVLLADSFTNYFRPISLDRPKILCPLNNVTLLDYAMDFLAGSAGVEELFVVCVSDQVEAYVMEQQQQQHTSWTTAKNSSSSSMMHVTVVKDTSITNAGDALREIDKRNLVQSDPFILMFGDIITNVDIVGALAAHKERRKKDSSAIMTLLMKHVGVSEYYGKTASLMKYSSIRSNTEDLVVGLDPTQDNRILVYDDDGDSSSSHNSKSVAVPCSFFSSHPRVDLRRDLVDCGIDICSPDVLARIADEFDYRDLRKQFVTNTVAEEEVGLQSKIYAHILRPTEYAARIHDFCTYAAVSRDLLRRWCYPVVPDNLPSGYEKQYRYTMQRHYLYREQKNGVTRVGRSSEVKGAGMIGSNCFIGEGCHIEGTVIGNYCRIEDNATVKDSHVWDSVEVGNGATVVQSILADACIVKAGAVISRGCIIGPKCIVGENVVLPEFTRLTLAEELEDDFEDEWQEEEEEEDEEAGREERSDEGRFPNVEEVISDSHIVGDDGKARVWKPTLEDEDDVADYKAHSIGFDPSVLFFERSVGQQEEGDDFSVDDHALEKIENDLGEYDDGTVTFGGMQGDTVIEGSGPGPYGRQKGVDVIKELKTICLEYEPTSPIENLAIELNSFKFSQNATYSDCTMAATLAILEKMAIREGTSDGKLVADFKSYLDHWAPLLQKMSIGLEEEKAIVSALEKSATEGGEMGQVLGTGTSFRFLLQTLHDEEIVSEDAILAWAAERRENIGGKDSASVTKLFQMQPVQDFLDWLEEESEEDSDEEDESEEE